MLQFIMSFPRLVFEYSLAVSRSPVLLRTITSSVQSKDEAITSGKVDASIEDATEFRQLSLHPARKERKRMEERRSFSKDIVPARWQRMHVDQDWTNVWPAAASYKHSAIPLPVRMGLNYRNAPIDRYGNAELMKIPNFFHLTPVAIRKHCVALRKFCTKWPEELKTEKDCRENFPVETITSDYCHSGQSIRNGLSRIVSLRVPLSRLQFDFHARDKFLRLIGDRYDAATDYVTIITDRCPSRKQNYDYAKYLLTALYFESWRTEPWEQEKVIADFDKCYWEDSSSKTAAQEIIERTLEPQISHQTGDGEDSVIGKVQHNPSAVKNDEKYDVVQKYQSAVDTLVNGGENLHSLEKYKLSVEKLLGFAQ